MIKLAVVASIVYTLLYLAAVVAVVWVAVHFLAKVW